MSFNIHPQPELTLDLVKLRALRISCGYTQEDVALSCGVSLNTISSIETGKFMPTTKLFFKMMRLYGVKGDELKQVFKELQ